MTRKDNVRRLQSAIICLLVFVTAIWVSPPGVEGVIGPVDDKKTVNQLLKESAPAVQIGSTQLLVKFRDQAVPAQGQQSVTKCAYCLRRFAQTFQSATSDNSNSLDLLMARQGAIISGPLFRAEPASVASPESVASLQTDQATTVASVKRNFKRRSSRAPAGAVAPALFHWYVVGVPANTDLDAACAEWRADSHVAGCVPNTLAQVTALPNDTYVNPSHDGTTWSTGAWTQSYADLWGLQKVKGVETWPTTDGTGTVVAVLDTGIDFTHPDLRSGSANNIWVNSEDLNKNGVLDPGEDRNGNGVLNCFEDVNCNGRPDFTPVAQGGDLNGIDDDGNGIIDDVSGWDYVTCEKYRNGVCASGFAKTPDPDPTDLHGHGSHCAGTIGAILNNSEGIAGVAPGTKIMALRGLNAEGSGDVIGLGPAMRYAADLGADVISNSWGGTAPPGLDVSPLEDAITYATSLGTAVVFAAGNSAISVLRDDGSCLFVPACLPGVITIGASTETDHKAFFSNFGRKIDVVTPGGGDLLTSGLGVDNVNNILSLRAAGTALGPLVGPSGNERYIRIAGTSMAAPHASGGLALILKRFPGEPFTDTNNNGVWDAGEPFSDFGIDGVSGTSDYGQGNGVYDAFTVEDARAALRLSSDDVGDAGRDWLTGFGRMNLLNAMSIQPRKQLSLVPNNQLLTGVVGQTIISLPVAIENAWLPVSGVSVTLISDNPGAVKILSPTSQNYGNFSSPKQAATQTFQLQVVSWMAQMSALPLRVRIQATGLATFDIPFNVPFAPSIPGWPVTVNKGCGFLVVSPILADLDADGDDEIVVGDGCSNLFAWNKDGTPVAGWPVKVAATVEALGTAAVANLDGDAGGRLEVVVGASDGKVYAFHNDGTPVAGWPQVIHPPISNSHSTAPGVSIADVDADGHLDVVAVDALLKLDDGTAYGSRVAVWRGDNGVSLPGWPQILPGDSSALSYSPTLADIDLDGKINVIVTANRGSNGDIGQVFAFKHDGTSLAGWPKDNLGTIKESAAAVGELDGQVGLEVVVGAGQKIYAWRSNGQALTGWPFQTSTENSTVNRVASSPAIANIDSLGLAEVIASTAGGVLHVLRGDGTEVPGWPRSIGTSGLVLAAAPVVVDIDHEMDGLPEIIIGGGIYDPSYYAFHANGNPVAGWPIPIGGWAVASPSLDDVDRDGDVDFFVAEIASGAERVHGLDFSGSYGNAVAKPWPTMHHDIQRTSNQLLSGVALLPRYPVFSQTAPDLTVTEGTPIQFRVVATDPNANLISLTATGLPEGASFQLLGDVNNSGQVDETDALLVTSFIMGTQTPTPAQLLAADMDGNGTLTVSDAVAVVGTLLGNQRRGLFSWTPTMRQGSPIAYTITFTAADNESLSAVDDAQITVQDTTPPVITVQRCNPVPVAPPGPRCQVIPNNTSTSIGDLVVFQVSATESSGDPLQFKATSGAFLSSFDTHFSALGDVTLNGDVSAPGGPSPFPLSALDAAWILQHVAGLRAFSAEQGWFGDVTNNGSISALDATRILQMVVGLVAPANMAVFTWHVVDFFKGLRIPVNFTVSDGASQVQQTINVQINP